MGWQNSAGGLKSTEQPPHYLLILRQRKPWQLLQLLSPQEPPQAGSYDRHWEAEIAHETVATVVSVAVEISESAEIDEL